MQPLKICLGVWVVIFVYRGFNMFLAVKKLYALQTYVLDKDYLNVPYTDTENAWGAASLPIARRKRDWVV